MELLQLCSLIGLQPELEAKTAAFAEDFEFQRIQHLLLQFRDYPKMTEARVQLRSVLGEDPDGIRILTCMLKASADAYEVYRERGFGHGIYVDTMKCYPRFIRETYERTGRLCFDRYWWTTRQAGCHLFRIGTLEYEIKQMENNTVIDIHIPSDADLSPAAVDASVHEAKSFFAKHFPELTGCQYRCHSWLMDPQLKSMLKDDSNILHFQKRFTLFDPGEAGSEYIQWVFKTDATDTALWPEDTSLQKGIKQHIEKGGVIREAYGELACKA